MRKMILPFAAVLAVALLFNCTGSKRSDEIPPRMESVVADSKTTMRNFEEYRRGPTYTPAQAETYLKGHIETLQNELSLGADEIKRTRAERDEWRGRYEKAAPSAAKWDRLVLSFWLVVGAAVLVFVGLVALRLYTAFSPVGASSSALLTLLNRNRGP